MKDSEDYIISSEIQFQIDRISEKVLNIEMLTDDNKIHFITDQIIDMLDDLAWMVTK